MFDMILAWLKTTALGAPSEPEVNKITAREKRTVKCEVYARRPNVLHCQREIASVAALFVGLVVFNSVALGVIYVNRKLQLET